MEKRKHNDYDCEEVDVNFEEEYNKLFNKKLEEMAKHTEEVSSLKREIEELKEALGDTGDYNYPKGFRVRLKDNATYGVRYSTQKIPEC